MENEYEKLLQSLTEGERTELVDGAEIRVRSAGDRLPGRLDPRTEAAMGLVRGELENGTGGLHQDLLANYDRLVGPPHPDTYDILSLIRYTFGWRSRDKAPEVEKKRHILHSGLRPFSLYEYRAPGAAGDAPCLLYIHGGAFVAGDIETVENQCRLLARLLGGAVFSVDYPLAPENPFPHGYEACRASLDWIAQNAAQLGVSPRKIGVGGDSAGGNLALALAVADRDSGTGKVACQCLVYPKLSSAAGRKDPHYYWSAAQFDNPDGDARIRENTRATGLLVQKIDKWYRPHGVARWDTRVSPIAAPCEGLPPTLMLTVEYDFLRCECDAYTRMLQQAGVRCRAIRYGGLTHGVFDRLGYAPQVEDMLREMADWMRSV